MLLMRMAALVVLASPGAAAAQAVRLGVDVLERDGFGPIEGQRVGLITNHTGLTSDGRTTIDLLHEADAVDLVRLFGPEHGLRGELDQAQIEDGVDGPTGLPVVSLYGPRRSPEAEHLADLDALVFDIQDIGCRFYTYTSTMKLAMAAAAEAGIRFVVLDRPNPIGGVAIEGPMLRGEESFVGCHSLPLRHGMTIGELAKLFLADGAAPGLELVVVPCEGWRRSMYWDETGLVWTDPSPNMRRLTQAIVYPGLGIMETTNISVGRGTDTPFERFGAPWIEPVEFAAALNACAPEGIVYAPRYFTPTASRFADERCGGVDAIVTDPKGLNAVDHGMAIAATLRELYPDAWQTDRYDRLLINEAVYQALLGGASADVLRRMTREGLEAFRERRRGVLMYD